MCVRPRGWRRLKGPVVYLYSARNGIPGAWVFHATPGSAVDAARKGVRFPRRPSVGSRTLSEVGVLFPVFFLWRSTQTVKWNCDILACQTCRSSELCAEWRAVRKWNWTVWILLQMIRTVRAVWFFRSLARCMWWNISSEEWCQLFGMMLGSDGSDSDATTTSSSHERLTREEKLYVLRHTRRQEPQGEEQQHGSCCAGPDSASSCRTLIIHGSLSDESWARLVSQSLFRHF